MRIRRRWVAALLALLAGFAGGLPAARADSWMPYGKRRVPDPTGRYYVVLEAARHGTGASFTFAAARSGSDPVTAQGTKGFEEAPKDFGLREGDTVLGRGALESAPLEVRVSSTGGGFAAMEEYGSVGGGDSFVWVGPDGAVRHVRRMADLFSKAEIEGFTHTVSSVWWFQAAWIDETANEVVVVGNGGHVRAVGIDSGKVRRAGDAEIRRGIALPDPEAAIPALDLAIARKMGGLEEPLRTLLADARAPLGARLRAAVALAATDDRRGAALLRATAEKAPAGPTGAEDRKYALANLPLLLGEAAIPVLKAALGPPTDSAAWWAALEGFVALGERAVPVLSAMLTEAGRSTDYRGGAAHALGKIGVKAGLPALLSAVADAEEYVANAALNAAIAIGKGSISKDLAAHLDGRTTQDHRLAMYFSEFKEAAAVAPLVRALARHAASSHPHATIREALVFQTGEDAGPETAAWEAWLARRAK